MWGFLAMVAWWVCVYGTWRVADARGRGPWRWTLLAVAVPLVALVVVWLLPSRRPVSA